MGLASTLQKECRVLFSCHSADMGEMIIKHLPKDRAIKPCLFCIPKKEKREVNKMKHDWKTWAKAAGVRCVKTMCQTAVAMIGTTVVMSEVNWSMVVSASVLAGVLSILTSLAGLPECPNCEEEGADETHG